MADKRVRVILEALTAQYQAAMARATAATTNLATSTLAAQAKTTSTGVVVTTYRDGPEIMLDTFAPEGAA